MGFFQIEAHESRRLLSAATGAQIIAADRKELKSATAQLTADQNAQPALTAADNAAIAAARAAVVGGSAQQKKLNADKAAAPASISADQAAITAAATNGLPTITADYKQIASDSGNPSALPADHAKRAAAQAAYNAAVSAAVSKLLADQTSTQQAIADDKAAIATMLQNSPAYTAALASQEADGEIVPVDQAIANAAGFKFQVDLNTYGGSTTIYSIVDNPSPYQYQALSSPDTVADQAEINFIQPLLTAAQNTQTSDQTADAASVATARSAALAGSSARAALRADNANAPKIHAQDVAAVATTAAGYLDPVITDYEQHNTQQLALDQAALHAVVAAAEHKIFVDDTAFANAIANDKAVIAATLQANAAYTSAVAKQQSDATTDANNVQTYQAILLAAQAKLAVDQANAPVNDFGTTGGFGSFGGGTSIYGDVLSIGNDQALGTGTVSFTGGSLQLNSDSSSLSYVGSGTLNLTGANFYAGSTIQYQGVTYTVAQPS
jgi:hypothetical protein